MRHPSDSLLCREEAHWLSVCRKHLALSGPPGLGCCRWTLMAFVVGPKHAISRRTVGYPAQIEREPGERSSIHGGEKCGRNVGNRLSRVTVLSCIDNSRRSGDHSQISWPAAHLYLPSSPSYFSSARRVTRRLLAAASNFVSLIPPSGDVLNGQRRPCATCLFNRLKAGMSFSSIRTWD